MSGHVKIDLQYVNYFRDRHGHDRVYFRRKGVRIALPHPDSDEFLAAYKRAKGEPEPAAELMPANRPGSFGALCEAYRKSAEFSDLAESTRRELKYSIRALVAEHGGRRLIKITKADILSWKDALAKKPGACNKMLRTVKQLMTFAEDRGLRPDNVGKGIKLMKSKRWRSWTDEELLAFEAKWPLGSRERTGYALALYTGQRRGDLVTLKWSSIAGDAFRLKQQKTGKEMVIPIAPPLAEALAAVHPRRDKGILTGDRGEALNPVYFGHIMADAIADAGLPQACVLHGLRKSTARILAELGVDSRPITGHQTRAMQDEYERDANQEKLARISMGKWAAKGQ